MAKRELIDTATDQRFPRDDEGVVPVNPLELQEQTLEDAIQAVGKRAEILAGTAVEEIASVVEGAEIAAPASGHEGFASEAEYRRHLFAVAADAPAEDAGVQSGGYSAAAAEPLDRLEADPIDNLRLREDLSRLKDEVDTIRARIETIKLQAETVVRSNLRWADASAHAQLGAYPWAKLAGAVAATVVVTKLLRKLPLGAIGSIAAPLVLGQLGGPSRRRR